MSRFECLNNNNWEIKKSLNEKNERNEKKYNKNKKDYYKKEKKTPLNNVKKEINFLDEKSFPSLVKSEGLKENTLKNYIGIVNHEIKTEKTEETLPPGWSMLYRKDNKIIIEKGKSYYNNYSKELEEENKRYIIANEILDNRYYERLELNEILGDISPYWNMDAQYEYDTREDEIIDEIDETDSEYDFEEDFY